MPPSREREIWTLVSFVKREKVAVRRGRDAILLYWMYAQKVHEKEGEGKACVSGENIWRARGEYRMCNSQLPVPRCFFIDVAILLVLADLLGGI